MPSDKFSISLPSELTAELEALARHDGVSRSFLIQEASARYVADRKTRDAANRHRASVEEALMGFDEIAASWGDDPRQGIEYLAEVRAEGDKTARRGTAHDG